MCMSSIKCARDSTSVKRHDANTDACWSNACASAGGSARALLSVGPRSSRNSAMNARSSSDRGSPTEADWGSFILTPAIESTAVSKIAMFKSAHRIDRVFIERIVVRAAVLTVGLPSRSFSRSRPCQPLAAFFHLRASFVLLFEMSSQHLGDGAQRTDRRRVPRRLWIV